MFHFLKELTKLAKNYPIFFKLTDKVRRLETLLTKCKESIKANKQKTSALTEVKDSLSKQLSEREADLIALTDTFNRTNAELTQLKTREQEEELQMAQAKMHMHQASTTDFVHITIL